MKVKLLCEGENYERIKKIFEENNIEVSNDATHIFMDLNHYKTNFIVNTTDGEVSLIDFKDIYLIESFGNIVNIHTTNKTYETNDRLYNYETQTLTYNFIRINKSQIVPLNMVVKISPQINSRLKLTLKNQCNVYVSRTYKHNFRHQIELMGGK